MRKITVLLVGFCAVFLTACHDAPSTRDLTAVKPFSLEKFLGTWYEIARLPHSFEKGLTNVKAEYSMRQDGKIQVLNSGMKNGKAKQIKGVAKFRDATDIGELRVSFFRPFYGDYRIVYLSQDGAVAIVTSSTRDYLWLLARSPKLDKAVLDDALARVRQMGFAVDRLLFP